MKFDTESRFPVPAERLADYMLDAEIMQAVHQDELGYEEWEEVETREDGDRLLRTLDVTPRVDLPGFIRSALGNSSGYREFQNWAPDRLSYRWRVEFELSKSIQMGGDCVLEDDGEGGSVRRIHAECTVSVPIVGGKIAGYLRDETVRTQKESAAALAAWIEEAEAGLDEDGDDETD